MPDGEDLPIRAIRLTAESTAGRRNRIGTLLAEQIPRKHRRDCEDDDGDEERPESD
ncbi:hypothetical protein [Streptomyces sp. ISL-100]|uniref:hypothetical protein n=1 Tax=Streptomyces sp. ISL-100 TaxID=2819173 RepID=UPI001BE97626|nr:hypothetical protein [Streptomyces sp. ISL-100]MBT2399498.1 hypothetical protein [Streptomyces sp. ISL-100]